MNAVDVLKYGHQTVLDTVAGVPESEWETGGVCGVWSTKNIIAHLASFEHVLVDVLCTFLQEGPTPSLDNFVGAETEFNDVQVDQRKEKSPRETLDEYNDTQARVLSLIVQIPPEKARETGTLPWYGMEYALDDYIAYAYYGHKREHMAQVTLFGDRLKSGG